MPRNGQQGGVALAEQVGFLVPGLGLFLGQLEPEAGRHAQPDALPARRAPALFQREADEKSDRRVGDEAVSYRPYDDDCNFSVFKIMNLPKI